MSPITAETLQRLKSRYHTDEAREVLSVVLCHVGGVVIDQDEIFHCPYDGEREMTKRAVEIFPIHEDYEVQYLFIYRP